MYRMRDEDSDVALRDQIYAITMDWPRYGYRTVTAELRRRGCIANSKRVRRIMKAEGLQCRRKPRRGLKDRGKGVTWYPNLAKGYTPTRINELWVTDFTYVRLFGAFIFVAIVLDAFSRRCIGWAIATHYRDTLTLEALRMATGRRRPGRGTIHHSDRGGSYVSDDYQSELLSQGFEISLSRPGKPADNGICERFMRTFKDDEIRVRDYLDTAEAYRSIAKYLNVTYNSRRLHSSLGYVPPAEFEAAQKPFLPTSA